jgi:hypothetical protein
MGQWDNGTMGQSKWVKLITDKSPRRKTSFNSIHRRATKIDGQSFGHAGQPLLAQHAS